jgi:hypothetical protein
VSEVILPSGMTLEALNYKYPTCSTCKSRGVRTHQVSKKKTAQTTWCELHNRPVEYEYFTGPKGKRWVATDIPCGEYVYEYRPTTLFLLDRSIC